MGVDRGEKGSGRACPFFPWLAAGVVFLAAIQVAVLTSSLVSLRLTRLVALGILVVALLAAWLVWRGLNDDGAIEPPWKGVTEQRRGRLIAGFFAALYLLLFAFSIWGAAMVWSATAADMFKFLGNMAGLILCIAAVQVFRVNRRFLPRAVRPGLWREALLLAGSAFYAFFTYQWLREAVVKLAS